MFFDLDEEEKRLCTTVDRMLGDRVDPVAMSGDASVVVKTRETVDSALADMGVPLILVGEDHGGLGLGLVALTAVAHTLGHHCAPSRIVETALAAWLIGSYGIPAQRERWLEPILSGQLAVSLALREKPGVWAPQQWAASLQDDRIEKHDVGPLYGPGIVIAGTREGLAIAEADAGDFTASQSPLDPTRPLGSLVLPASRVAMLADPEAAQRLYQALLILNAADAAGAGQRALAMSVDYAKSRQQFGQPIGAFQAIKHQLAAMAVDIEPAHFPCWYAAHCWQSGNPEAARAARMAKAHATDMAVKTCRAAVEAHGGIAYTWDYPLHLCLKRAMQDRALLGTPMALRKAIAELDAKAEGRAS